jgi:HMG (high mobility group) box
MRVDLKGRHLSFTEIAKLVGENWQSLPPNEKEPYETQAFNMKEKYNAELAEYKKTEIYRKYMEYLNEFKNRQAGVQHGMHSELHPLPRQSSCTTEF